MDKNDEARKGNFPGKGRKSGRRDLLVFAFFLVLSFFFWYLNSLSRDLEADIKYPVSYVNTPGDRTLAGNLPSRLTLDIKGPGYSILGLRISGKKSPLKVDLSKVPYRRIRNPGQSGYYIVSSGLVPDFNSQLRGSINITSVKPDTLFFSFK